MIPIRIKFVGLWWINNTLFGIHLLLLFSTKEKSLCVTLAGYRAAILFNSPYPEFGIIRVIPKSRLYRIFFRYPWKSRLAIQKFGIRFFLTDGSQPTKIRDKIFLVSIYKNKIFIFIAKWESGNQNRQKCDKYMRTKKILSRIFCIALQDRWINIIPKYSLEQLVFGDSFVNIGISLFSV